MFYTNSICTVRNKLCGYSPLLQPSPPMPDTTNGMTSLKDIAAEAVVHHDLLDARKRDHILSSDHQPLHMRCMYMYTI